MSETTKSEENKNLTTDLCDSCLYQMLTERGWQMSWSDHMIAQYCSCANCGTGIRYFKKAPGSSSIGVNNAI